MDERRRVRPGRPINFEDSYDDSDDNTDVEDDEQEWVPLLRRQNAIRRRGVSISKKFKNLKKKIKKFQKVKNFKKFQKF